MGDSRFTAECGGRIVFPFAGRLSVIDENNDFLLVDKPAGMPVHPSKPDERGTLWNHLGGLLAFECATGGAVSIITRLDRETSGLTLVAKHRSAARSLCRRMEAHAIRKTYLALVFGWPAESEWVVDQPLLRLGSVMESKIWLKQGIHPAGYPSKTRFGVLWKGFARCDKERAVSLLSAMPVTGRMHQIRVHAAWSGYPLVGDKIYGVDDGCYLEFIETGWTESLENRLLMPRHALHAWRLSFDEPGARWECPVPEDIWGLAGDLVGLPEYLVGDSGQLFGGSGRRGQNTFCSQTGDAAE